MSKKFVPMGDLSSLTPEQQQQYVVTLSEHLGLAPELNLVRLIWDDDGTNARKLIAYVLKGGTDIIRDKRKIDTTGLTNNMVGGAIVFTATGKDSEGRHEIAAGAKSIDGLQGKALDDAIMTAQTRATRRMTIQFVGGGVLDESELNLGTTNINSQSTSLAELALAPAQPTVKPNDAPGADVTEAAVEIGKAAAAAAINGPQATVDALKSTQKPLMDAQEHFEAVQKALRDAAIAQLNAPATDPKTDPITDPIAEAAPKKRRGRGPNKPKPVLTPTDLANQMTLPIPPAEPTQAEKTFAADVKLNAAIAEVISVPTQAVAAVPTQANPVKGLTTEQVKPYRQRLFRLNNDHFEQNGLIQKEGLGRSEQLRMLASMMFPGITNFNEMTVEQWEKYLGNLEDRVKKDGAKATVEYIQESIGI